MENRGLIPVLVTMMLVTGVCNTILNKYQVRALFQPVLQIEPSLTPHPRKGHAMCERLRSY